jgi:hypothetical protein
MTTVKTSKKKEKMHLISAEEMGEIIDLSEARMLAKSDAEMNRLTRLLMDLTVKIRARGYLFAAGYFFDCMVFGVKE